MKRILIAASALMLMAGVSQAQTTENKEKKEVREGKFEKRPGAPFRQRGDVMKDLNLTDAQKKQVKEIRESYRKKAAELRKEQMQKTESVLTAEQKAKLAEKRKGLAEKRKEFGEKRKTFAARDFKGRAGFRGARGPEQMKARLGLNDDQVAKMKANNKDFQEKAKAIRQNEKLDADQKKQQLKQLAEQNRENLKSILTAEQLEKMKGAPRKGGSK